MTSSTDDKRNEFKIYLILLGYPIVLLLVGFSLNHFLFEIKPYVIALPSKEHISAFVIAAVLLTINHTWIMTATEIIRTKFKIHSTPEEWIKSGSSESNVLDEGVSELKRCHDTHLNTTENSIYFALLGLPFILVSPPVLVAIIWLVGYAVARLGYTYGFLYGKDGTRGLFMSLSLLAMYGMASYLVASLFK